MENREMPPVEPEELMSAARAEDPRREPVDHPVESLPPAVEAATEDPSGEPVGHPVDTLPPVAEETPVDHPVESLPVAEETPVGQPVDTPPVAEEPPVGHPVDTLPVTDEPPVGQPVETPPVAEEPPVGQPVDTPPAAEAVPVDSSGEPADHPVDTPPADAEEPPVGHPVDTPDDPRQDPADQPVDAPPVADEPPVGQPVDTLTVADEPPVGHPVDALPVAEATSEDPRQDPVGQPVDTPPATEEPPADQPVDALPATEEPPADHPVDTPPADADTPPADADTPPADADTPPADADTPPEHPVCEAAPAPTAEPPVSTTTPPPVRRAPAVENCNSPEEPPIFYDMSKRKYVYRNSNKTWLHLNQGEIKKILTANGLNPKALPGETMSEVDREILAIRDDWAVDFSGELAGYKEGIHRISSKCMLVTRSPALITPEPIEWNTVRAVFEAVLGDERHDQLTFFYAWLKLAYESFKWGNHMPGQALVMTGPADCGKSLIQKLITEIFGGRMARPYEFMTGKTNFNSEMFRAEHLVVEDDVSELTEKQRARMSSMIKQLTVNEEQRLHHKGLPALIVRPCWRVSITVNDDPENLRVIPRISESLADKIHLMMAYKRDLPLPTSTHLERALAWKTYCEEIPGLIHWLTTEFVIPAELRSGRFGVTHFHHTAVLEKLNATTPEAQLMELIDSCIQTPYTGSLLDLHNRLQPHPVYRQMFTMQTLGNSLSHLSEQMGSRVTKQRSASSNRWSIGIPPPASRTPEATASVPA